MVTTSCHSTCGMFSLRFGLWIAIEHLLGNPRKKILACRQLWWINCRRTRIYFPTSWMYLGMEIWCTKSSWTQNHLRRKTLWWIVCNGIHTHTACNMTECVQFTQEPLQELVGCHVKIFPKLENMKGSTEYTYHVCMGLQPSQDLLEALWLHWNVCPSCLWMLLKQRLEMLTSGL